VVLIHGETSSAAVAPIAASGMWLRVTRYSISSVRRASSHQVVALAGLPEQDLPRVLGEPAVVANAVPNLDLHRREPELGERSGGGDRALQLPEEVGVERDLLDLAAQVITAVEQADLPLR
jgi:hypothetical protein